MSRLSKDTWKAVRSCVQWVILAAIGIFVVQLFIERGSPPQFDRESWTQRDGFTAISYGSLTRDESRGSIRAGSLRSIWQPLKRPGISG